MDRLKSWTARASLSLAFTGLASAASAQDEVWPPERIKAEWVGKKVFARGTNGALADFWLKEDGSSELATNNFTDTGAWRLSDTGYCVKWQRVRNGEERCFTVRTVRGQVQVFNPDGSVQSTIIRVQ